MIEWEVSPEHEGVRIDVWLAARPEIGSRGRARDAIERGKVFLNGEELTVSGAGHRLTAGDRVGLWMDRPGSARRQDREVVASRAALRVIHEDEALLVVDKPAGWLVEPLPGEAPDEVTLLHLARDRYRGANRRPLVVHRIDRDTTGLVAFALSEDARDRLKAQFERRTPERVYLAVVHGQVTPVEGTWRDYLVWDGQRRIQRVSNESRERAREAVAHYRVREQGTRGAVLEVRLVTGKRNQIRVQAGVRGLPLVGERIYTFGFVPPPGSLTFGRQALHAKVLGLRHPVTDRLLRLEAAVPQDLAGLIARLRSGRS